MPVTWMRWNKSNALLSKGIGSTSARREACARRSRPSLARLVAAPLAMLAAHPLFAAGGGGHGNSDIVFPKPLSSYHDGKLESVLDIMLHRAQEEPFNVLATLVFFAAICHTFMAGRFLKLAHHYEHIHEERIAAGKAKPNTGHIGAGILHFFGEVEVIFGLWSVILLGTVAFYYDWSTAVYYLAHKVNFTEPIFVVVIMTLSATRPILKLAEMLMWRVANFFGGMLVAWWLTILTVGPILGSFITEPAAMTISALLLSQKFYELNPKDNLKYATIALLFVNISVGGTLTHFAAPPVLMVVGPWEWDLAFMLSNFGWKACIGIVIANYIYYRMYKTDLEALQLKYAVVRLGNELRVRHMPREELLAEFEKMETILNDQLRFGDALDDKFEEIKVRMRTNIVRKLVGRDVDLDSEEAERLFDDLFDKEFTHFKETPMSGVELFEWAFENRFREIKQAEMQRAVPGLLPKHMQPPFLDPDWNSREDWVPWWVMAVHVAFMIWTVFNAHHPVLFVAGLLFFLGFSQATSHYQNYLDLKGPLLVGFFLAGLVIHGGVQGWWIAPVLGSLSELPLMVGAIILTSFNDNAAITYLSTLVPNMTDELKLAVVAGAVTGGGLTVIANAPNPAGMSILKGYFKNGVSPIGLVRYALIPTVIMGACFYLL
ncbi:Putative Na+/H+ antiporter [Sulfidibacter corallicola]|uniref:Na+/H+ antiporter n=1 Tax=Sulfidibacter corallicola TaxID=2818388 RepID=A0A8A4TPR6_SULCO|nr:putative Na+/H+ antiporter [Sulfidibacter corallicola]QTD51543.1 hypothetical protein J3U87_03660 [Sulfidibacter corallicola]